MYDPMAVIQRTRDELYAAYHAIGELSSTIDYMAGLLPDHEDSVYFMQMNNRILEDLNEKNGNSVVV